MGVKWLLGDWKPACRGRVSHPPLRRLESRPSPPLSYFAGLLESEVFVILRTGIWGGERRTGGVYSPRTVRVEKLSSSFLFMRRKAFTQFLIKLRLVRPWARRRRRAARPAWEQGLGGNGCMHVCGWAPWLSTGNSQHCCVLFLWLCRVVIEAYGIEFPDWGSKPGPLHPELRVLTTGPGKSLTTLLISSSPIENKKFKKQTNKHTKPASSSHNVP